MVCRLLVCGYEQEVEGGSNVVMALEALCGFDKRLSFSSLERVQKCDLEVESYSRNFINNLELAVPPYGNVSTYPLQNFSCCERC
jgi:hypothetical protein